MAKLGMIMTVWLMVGIAAGYPIRDLTLAEYKVVAKETFKAFKVTDNIDGWLKCFGNFLEEANENLNNGNKNVQEVDIKRVLELLKALGSYRNYVMMCIYDCKPCANIDTNPDIKRIRNMIENINWEALLHNLITKFQTVMQDFIYVREFWNRQDLPAYGQAIGTLLMDCLAL